MNSIKKVMLVDPDTKSRGELRQMLDGIGSACVVGECTSFGDAPDAARAANFDVLLIVLDHDVDEAVETIRRLRAAGPGIAILPASRVNDGATILRVMRAGAQEFLPLPSPAEEVVGALDRLMPSGRREQGAKMLAVTGASGGVGCTTLAVNLARALSRAPGESVALVDLDLLTSAVDTSLDLVADQTLVDLVAEVDRLDPTLLRRAMTRHPSGIHILTGPPALEDAARIDPEALRKVLELLRRSYSFVVVDTSKALQATDFTAYEMADAILLVVQLELCCLRNSARLLQLFRQCDGLADRVQVVVNRAGFERTGISTQKAAETLGVSAPWQVPDDAAAIGAARNKGVPLEVEAPGSRTTRAIQQIAASFAPSLGRGEKKPPRKRMTLTSIFT